MYLTIAVTQPRGKRSNSLAVDETVGDESHRAPDNVGAAVPFRRTGRGIRPTALAGAVAMRLCSGRGTKEFDVVALGRDCRARRPAVDARGTHSGDEPAVKPRVAALACPVALLVVEWKHVDHCGRCAAASLAEFRHERGRPLRVSQRRRQRPNQGPARQKAASADQGRRHCESATRK